MRAVSGAGRRSAVQRFETVTARALLSGLFLWGGVDTLRRPDGRIETAHDFLEAIRRRVPVPADRTAVRVNAAAQALAGAALLCGIKPRAAAVVLASSLVPTTIAAHAFWRSDLQHRTEDLVAFLSNAAILGGLLALLPAAHPEAA